MTDGALRREPALLAISAGLAGLCLGTALAIAGVVVPGLFLPGVILIVIGLLACAAAAVLRLMRPPADAAPSAVRT